MGLSRQSTLRRLAEFAAGESAIEVTAVQSIPWSRPNWNKKTLWRACSTSRFADCLHRVSERDRNIFLNTLMTVASPKEGDLCETIHERHKPSWYMSSLRGYSNNVIVWLAKEGYASRPTIEAHFAGSKAACLTFQQINYRVPDEARIVKRGLTGLSHYVPREGGMTKLPNEQPQCLWVMTNTTQAALTHRELPRGSIQLDPEQETLVRLSKPPMIIESRSGTGKTLVLLQHAAFHHDKEDVRPTLFVTVSPRLRNELVQQFQAMNEVENFGLTTPNFYTFVGLLDALLIYKRISEFDGKSRCTFLSFFRSKSSHSKSEIEPQLIESEIGGVILVRFVAYAANLRCLLLTVCASPFFERRDH
jgi:hypothetical protein